MNPTYQHLFHCLAARAIRPGQVLPDVPEHVLSLMKAPENEDGSTLKALKRLEEAFALEEVEKKKGKVTGADAFGDAAKKRCCSRT